MIAQITQVKSNFENKFEVSCDNKIVYYAEAPWMNVSLPFNAENVRELVFYNDSKEVMFSTDYKIINNVIEEAIPYKYLITGEQNVAKYEIVGKDQIQGSFFVQKKGWLDRKFCIEYENEFFTGYFVDKGEKNVVSIFDGDIQIAQITKPLATSNNLDIYYLHLLDEYSYLFPILSFFTVYYDHRNYNNSGQISNGSAKISWTYSYDKNSEKHDKSWISEQFSQEISDELDAEIKKHRASSMKKIKKMAKLIGMIFLICYSIIGIVLFFLWKNGKL